MWLRVSVLCAVLVACGSDSKQGGAPRGASASLIGAWSGTMIEPPDDREHCLVLCANGRLFNADQTSGCTDLADQDFSSYLDYRIENERIVLADAAGDVATLTVQQAEEQATFVMDWQGTQIKYSLRRVSDTHAACARTDAMLRTRQ